jgi:hypothetical protein
MTRKERAFVIEGGAIALGGMFGAVVVPTLVSAHDSVALFAGVALLLGWIGWVAYFFYRINGSKIDG